MYEIHFYFIFMVEKRESSDVNREWLTPAKIIHFLRVLFSERATHAILSHKQFSDIDFWALWQSGKKGIILDIDECVAPHHGDILPENSDIIQTLKTQGWKIVVFSNMKKTDRYIALEELWIPVCTSPYAKPDARWFQDALQLLETSTQETVMIGDNFLTDGGAIRAGIDFIKIEPIDTQDRKKSISRYAQIFLRSLITLKINIILSYKQ
jgi:uncharacterized protein